MFLGNIMIDWPDVDLPFGVLAGRYRKLRIKGFLGGGGGRKEGSQGSSKLAEEQAANDAEAGHCSQLGTVHSQATVGRHVQRWGTVHSRVLFIVGLLFTVGRSVASVSSAFVNK
jgi:hypothetical protein